MIMMEDSDDETDSDQDDSDDDDEYENVNYNKDSFCAKEFSIFFFRTLFIMNRRRAQIKLNLKIIIF